MPLPDPEDLSKTVLERIILRVQTVLYTYVDYYGIQYYDPELEIDPLNTPDDVARVLHDFGLVRMTDRVPNPAAFVLPRRSLVYNLERLDKVDLADIVRRVRRILLQGAREGDDPEDMLVKWNALMDEWGLRPMVKKQDWRPPRRKRRP